MLVIPTKEKIIENAETGETGKTDENGENSKNGKNGDKSENLGINLTQVPFI